MEELFQIVPYSPEHEEGLLELERMSPQGFLVKLQMIRPHFQSRAVVFEDYQVYVALGQDNSPIACAIGAQVPISINGEVMKAGYGFNVRVVPQYRNMGLGRELAKHVSEHFFEPKKLHPQFTTLRTSNLPMMKLLSKSYRNTFLYEFAYLTFSTARGLQVEQVEGPDPLFQVDLLSCHDRLTEYYQTTKSGLGLWKAYLLYQLKITSISPIARASFWMGNLLMNDTRILPDTDTLLKTVTVFNVNQTNIHTLPEVALQLYKEDINYMQVCCRPDDVVYRALHRKAINVYRYFLVSTEEINPQERLTMDVRCM